MFDSDTLDSPNEGTLTLSRLPGNSAQAKSAKLLSKQFHNFARPTVCRLLAAL